MVMRTKHYVKMCITEIGLYHRYLAIFKYSVGYYERVFILNKFFPCSCARLRQRYIQESEVNPLTC